MHLHKEAATSKATHEREKSPSKFRDLIICVNHHRYGIFDVASAAEGWKVILECKLLSSSSIDPPPQEGYGAVVSHSSPLPEFPNRAPAHSLLMHLLERAVPRDADEQPSLSFGILRASK